MDYRDRLEIDLKDLCLNILAKWKLLIIGAILGALCMAGYSIYAPTQAEVQYESDTYDLISSRGALTEASAIWVEQNVVDSFRCKELLKDYLAVNEYVYEVGSIISNTYVGYAYATTAERTYYVALIAEIIAHMNAGGYTRVEDWLNSIGATDYTYASMLISEIENSNTATATVNTSSTGLNIKYVLIGLVAGIFVVALLLALKYVFDQNLKTIDDMSIAFEVPVLGVVENGKGVELTASKVSAAIKNTELKKVLFSGSIDDNDIFALKDSIIKDYKDAEVSVDKISSIISDPDAVDSMTEADGIVLFEKIGQSKYDDIAKELDLCKNLGVKVLGCVVIKGNS